MTYREMVELAVEGRWYKDADAPWWYKRRRVNSDPVYHRQWCGVCGGDDLHEVVGTTLDPMEDNTHVTAMAGKNLLLCGRCLWDNHYRAIVQPGVAAMLRAAALKEGFVDGLV